MSQKVRASRRDRRGRRAIACRSANRVPFQVQHRRQAARLARDVADEPAGLLLGRGAEVEEVIGAARHARRGGAVPLPRGTRGSARSPPSVALTKAKLTPLARAACQSIAVLPAGHVDAVDGQCAPGRCAPSHGIGIAEVGRRPSPAAAPGGPCRRPSAAPASGAGHECAPRRHAALSLIRPFSPDCPGAVAPVIFARRWPGRNFRGGGGVGQQAGL